MTYEAKDWVSVIGSAWGENENKLAQVIEGPDSFGNYLVRIQDYKYTDGDAHPAREDELRLVSKYKEADPINPTHYQFPGGIQVIDITRHLGFLEGNIVKYVARAGRKGAAKEDLLKARQYLDWLIEDTDA